MFQRWIHHYLCEIIDVTAHLDRKKALYNSRSRREAIAVPPGCLLPRTCEGVVDESERGGVGGGGGGDTRA